MTTRATLTPLGAQKTSSGTSFSPLDYDSDLAREYCNWETFNANCSPGNVVLMTTAKYGRMRHGRCVPEFYDKKGNQAQVGCFEDIIR